MDEDTRITINSFANPVLRMKDKGKLITGSYPRAQASRKEVFIDEEKGEERSAILSGCH